MITFDRKISRPEKRILRFEEDIVSRPFQRPKAIYTNCPSPYGIADELFDRKLTKQCYAG